MARLVGDNAPLEGQRDRSMADDWNCFNKARQRGLQTFTLIETDPSAPLVILQWIILNWHTSPIAKLRDAFEDALCMKASTKPKKNHD